MHNKRVLLIGPIPPPHGGIATYCRDIINSYLKNKFKIKFFNISIPLKLRPTFNTNNQTKNIFKRDGILNSIRQLQFVFINYIKFLTLIIKNKFEILHIISCTGFGFWRNGIFIILSKIKNIKVIFHVVGEIDVFWNQSNYIKRIFISFFLNISDIIIVQSDGIKNQVEKMSKTNVKTIVNGTDIDLYKLTKPKNYSSEKFNIITVGVLGRRKGYYDLIECALKLVKMGINNINFIFVGGGEINLFKKLIISKKIDNIISIYDNINNEEKIRLIEESHLFALPTYNEGQPISIIEAMCCGLPILSTKVGAIPELILPKNGHLIEPGNLNQLKEGILKYYDNRKLASQTSEFNHLESKKRFTLLRVYKELEDIYKTI